MRIAYGVHGYCRGHAARATAILSSLTHSHQVKVFAGGDAYDALSELYDVQRIPALSYRYGGKGHRSNLRTVVDNLPEMLDLFGCGDGYRGVYHAMRDFAPDVVISDADAWTHRVARALRIPRIGFDHYGILVYCKAPMPWMDRVKSLIDRVLYRMLIGRPEHVLIASFYSAPPRGKNVHIVRPPLREQVYRLRPHQGDHLLVYFNQGQWQLTPSVIHALREIERPVRLYGARRDGVDGNIEYMPPSDGFLDDLASCTAVLSTAGNQLVAEAMHYGKPMLVVPEKAVEQRTNARAVERMGIGEVTSFEELTGARIQRFLDASPLYARRALRRAADGRVHALAAIDRWLEGLPAAQPVTALEEAA